MKKLTISTALLAALAVTGTAQAYQFEANAGYAHSKADDVDVKSNAFAIGGSYYLAPVDVKNYPLAEAAFMNRASNLNAFYGYSKTEAANVDGKLNTGVVGIEYYIPNSDFYLSGNVGFGNSKILGQSIDSTTYAAEVGYLPTANLLVAIGLAGQDVDHGDNDTDPTIRAKYVKQLAGDTAFNVEAAARFNDNADQYNVGADYFIDRTLSLGVEYDRTALSGNDEDAFGIRARKFFTQDIAVEANALFGDDYKTYGIAATYRF